MAIFLSVTLTVLCPHTSFSNAQIVPDSSTGTIIYIYGATPDNGLQCVGVSRGKSRRSVTWAGLGLSAPAEECLAQGFGGAIAIEIEVQRGAGNPQALRHFGRIRLTLPHGGHGHAQRGFRHFARPATPPPPRPRRRESGARALTDQVGFKFGQRRKNPKYQAAVRGRGIDLRSLASHDLQSYLPLVQGLD